MPDDQLAATEAREVPAWTPADGPVRTRSWPRGGPVISVYTGGQWRTAHVMQRQDRASGLTTYHVRIVLDEQLASAVHRVYAWHPASIRPVRPATVDPIEGGTEGRATGRTRPSV